MKPMETIQASFDHLIRENPMGEARKDALKLDFDRRLKLDFLVVFPAWYPEPAGTILKLR